MNLEGTEWIRNSDGREIAVVDDRHHEAGSLARPLRIRNLTTDTHHWTSPDRLTRKHKPTKGHSVDSHKFDGWAT